MVYKISNIISIIFVVIYLVLVLCSISFIFANDDDALFSGIFAILLTWPWSLFLSGLVPPDSDNFVIALLLVLLGAAINTAILYFGSRWLVRRLAR